MAQWREGTTSCSNVVLSRRLGSFTTDGDFRRMGVLQAAGNGMSVGWSKMAGWLTNVETLFPCPSRGQKVHVTTPRWRSAIKVCAMSKVEATPRNVNIGLCRIASRTCSLLILTRNFPLSRIRSVEIRIFGESAIRFPGCDCCARSSHTSNARKELTEDSLSTQHYAFKSVHHVARQQHPVLGPTS
jgi:hypothetical protein